MRAVRPLSLAGLLALTACGGATGPLGPEEAVLLASAPASAPRAVAPERAFAALPPEAGAVIATDERRYANGVAQTITLAADANAVGENVLEIGVRTAAPRTAPIEEPEKEIPMVRPTGESIAAELAARFPGMAMVVSDEDTTNAYGPFGYAAGRGPGGVTCVYAWQRVEDVEGAAAERAGWLAGFRRPASVRIRLCRSAPEGRIVDWVKRLQLQVDGAGRPLGPAGTAGPSRAPDGGAADALGTASAGAGFPRAPAVAADGPTRQRRAERARSPDRERPASRPPAADPGRYAAVPAPR